MNVKKISIITLTYKNWHLLDNAISSVASQIVESQYELEYLIVDDGTNDFDKEYINSLLCQTKLNYRIIVNPENMGTVASFNNAIRQSQGDIIIPLSADDMFFDPSVVMSIVNMFKGGDDLIITALRYISNGRELDYVLPTPKDRNFFGDSKKLLKKIMLFGNIISGACTYYHRQVFDKLGCFDETYRLLEDYPYYLRALSSGINIKLMDRITIIYNDNGLSSKGRISDVLLRDYLRLHENNLKTYKLNFFEKRYIIYNKIYSRQQRIKSALLYFDQVVLWGGLYLIRRVLGKVNK